MKKILLLLMVLLFTGCEPNIPIDEVDCDKTPNLEECMEPNDDNEPQDMISGYDFDVDSTNLGHGSEDTYTERDLVPEECSHLDNIGEWQPVWCEEFDYEGLPDSTKWSYDVGGHGWGNNELQFYTEDDTDNAFVEGGVLVIRTVKENYQDNTYTSARLISKNQGDWLYGKIQVRAKVPAGKGTWPAIWMLPTDWEYGGWPNSGEIDIMEYVGYQPNTIHGTIHTGAYNHSIGTQVGKSTQLETAEEEFHVYEMEWEVNVIRLYIDGELFTTFTYTAEDNTTNENYMAWPFDQRFHLLLNTAFGGNWGGAQGIDSSISSIDFAIDYVRVYQKDYAGMDQTAPEDVTNVATLSLKNTSAFVSWTHANDDVMVKQYNIYVDDELYTSTTVNGILLTALNPSTTYTIKIVSEDFKGQLSQGATLEFTTLAPPTINDRIEAEDYTSMSGIDTQTTSDTDGGMNVGWVDTNDYLTYELIVSEAGTYMIDFRLASETNGANFSFYKDQTLLFTMNTDATGAWQNWVTETSPSFTLTPGTYTFKILALNDGFNINYFEFKKVD